MINSNKKYFAIYNRIFAISIPHFNTFLTKMFHVKPHAPYELEAIPRKLKLAKEIRDLFQPLSSYIPQNHKGRAHPLTQIHNAYHMPIDTSEYLVNRAYYSKLYKSMRGADISHQDILAIWGNPYIGVAIGWDKVPHTR